MALWSPANLQPDGDWKNVEVGPAPQSENFSFFLFKKNPFYALNRDFILDSCKAHWFLKCFASH